jgi:hypothetical protein
MKTRAFFYFRSPAYARAKGGHYVPDTTDDRKRQLDLKRRIKNSGFSVTGYRDPEALAKRIERDLWKLLDTEFPASDVPDAFLRESMQHEAYAVPRRRLYLGGERYQVALEKELDAEEQRTVIEGESGGGKSALIANFFDAYRKRHPKHQVLEHYLGASADAADPHALVRRLCEFIKRQTNSTEEISNDPQTLMDGLPLWLATASAWARKCKTKFIVVLDSLNSLTDLQDLRWFPEFMPKGIVVVVSCLPGTVLDALKGKNKSLPGQVKLTKWKSIHVRPLTKTQSANLLNNYLASFNKKLHVSMVRQVQTHPLATNPLFVRTLAEELRLFGLHEELQKRLDHYLSSQSIDEMFERVLQRVETDCGHQKVRASMRAIWASQAGLSDKEIMGIVKLAPSEWAAIRLALEESLLDVSGLITFAHQYVRSSVSSRFIKTHQSELLAHRSLAEWFSKLPMNSRRVFEEPYQWSKARAWKELQNVLTNADFFSMATESPAGELQVLGYWNTLEAKGSTYLSKAYSLAWKHWCQDESKIAQAVLARQLFSFLYFLESQNGLM